MKTNKIQFATILFTTTAALAMAEDLPQTKIRQQVAVTQGMGGTPLAVLQRTGSSEAGAVSSALLEKLNPAASRVPLMNSAETFSLQVTGDGTGAEFRDMAVAARAHSLGKPASQQMPAAELEQKGRAFIASHLASQIVLGAGEELVALRADYRTEGGQDLKTGATTSAVVANRIVFGRLIGGVPVVGNGSKVILTFTNDGALESFHYDWPRYQTGSAQTMVDSSEVLARVQKVLAVRSGVGAAKSAAAVTGTGANAYPVVLTPNTLLQALDCGYYDAGSAVQKGRPVQPGCTYLTVSQDSNGMRQGYAGAVPAGASFVPDAAWMEAKILQ